MSAIAKAWDLFEDEGDAPSGVRDEDAPPPLASMEGSGEVPEKQTSNRSSAANEAWEIFDGEDEDDDLPPPEVAEGDTITGPETEMSSKALQGFVEEHLGQTCKDLSEAVGRADLASLLARLRDAHFGGSKEQDRSDVGLALARQVSDAAWHRLTRGGGWDHVCWREAYVFAQLFAAHALAQSAQSSDHAATEGTRIAFKSMMVIDAFGHAQNIMMADEKLRLAVKHLDMAIIMGGPAELVQLLLDRVEPIIVANSRSNRNDVLDQSGAHLIVKTLPQSKFTPTIAHPIHQETSPSLAHFRKAYFDAQQPVVITGATSAWRALEKWRDLSYLDQEYGHRTVPVEIGRPQDASEEHKAKEQKWKESAITLGEFIRSYLLPSSKLDYRRLCSTDGGSHEELSFDQIGYLAQHALIEQLPSLKSDYRPPPYCALGSLSNINAWLGTSGTVTSLHFDSYDNFLTQVAGFKYVRLYHPSQTPYLYRDAPDLTSKVKGSNEQSNEADKEEMAISEHSAKAQGNFSAVVNIENPDMERYPLLAQATYSETVLGPGQMLFIPRGCWHYVRSLSTSFSLNFWF